MNIVNELIYFPTQSELLKAARALETNTDCMFGYFVGSETFYIAFSDKQDSEKGMAWLVNDTTWNTSHVITPADVGANLRTRVALSVDAMIEQINSKLIFIKPGETLPIHVAPMQYVDVEAAWLAVPEVIKAFRAGGWSVSNLSRDEYYSNQLPIFEFHEQTATEKAR